ncbi:4-hydroxy-tetrahydrodipicolinate synthase [Aerococcus urinaehominis]|uniref:4-hydroxy-tetrahydrodipicolinate synthase n=1 Tax=Aerococcus urinaehominis TaxID=128944 RepID=A0A0X8FKL8_9LACT|nr:4-hydroxy-tetrahydrodipicolinate synthase [Aerococcus urinaehominis]AMB99047.1 4-hydroxy-tetrahydrodipicolinate synthase [Aerococcus urinaehominis]SDM50526.1 4-hydroxy-tetrahydrodipicolinate synthase [Aerococcus urinaehominis]
MAIYSGSGVAIVTPYNNDDQQSINYDVFKKMVDFQINNGTDAIIVAGTTGEASTQTDQEQIDLVKFTVDYVAGRVPVIAGAGSNDTRHGVALTKACGEAGADAILSVTPYYLKTNQSGLYKHFEQIANATDKDIILYDVPGRTGMSIAPETLGRLAQINNIVALKDATGDFSHAVANFGQIDSRQFAIYSGNDDVVVPLMSLGGRGVISVLANIAPQAVHEMTAAALNGDYAKASLIQVQYKKLTDILFQEPNPIPVKAALRLLGFEVGPVRLPLGEAEEATVQALEAEMKQLGLI